MEEVINKFKFEKLVGINAENRFTRFKVLLKVLLKGLLKILMRRKLVFLTHCQKSRHQINYGKILNYAQDENSKI